MSMLVNAGYIHPNMNILRYKQAISTAMGWDYNLQLVAIGLNSYSSHNYVDFV